jgi:hypothetical protein
LRPIVTEYNTIGSKYGQTIIPFAGVVLGISFRFYIFSSFRYFTWLGGLGVLEYSVGLRARLLRHRRLRPCATPGPREHHLTLLTTEGA